MEVRLQDNFRKVVLLFIGFTIGMHVAVFLHELGHALGIWLSGGTVTAIVMEAPLPIGYVAGANGSDFTRIWGGVAFGSLSTLIPLLAAKRLSAPPPIRFAMLMIAAFCLGHNAVYLFVGSIVPFADAAQMIGQLGTPRWLLFLLSIPLLIGFVLVLTSAIQSAGLCPTDSVWTWILVIELGLLATPALMLTAPIFVPTARALRSPMLLLVSTYAVCFCIVAFRGHSLIAWRGADIDRSQRLQNWSATLKLLVIAMLLIAVEWIVFSR